MIHRAGRVLSRIWAADSGPYGLLILLFGTIFVLAPLLSARMVSPFILEIAFALILVAGAFNVTSRASVRGLALVLAVLSVVMGKLGLPISERAVVAADMVLSVGMLAAFTVLMIKRFLVRGREPAHRIAGAVAVYLLLGLIWARLYQVVELASPGAFRVPEGESPNSASLAYFSFVTLATLGYGDISPVNILARDLAVLEAIMGQLYLVILISRLVTEGVEKSEKGQGGFHDRPRIIRNSRNRRPIPVFSARREIFRATGGMDLLRPKKTGQERDKTGIFNSVRNSQVRKVVPEDGIEPAHPQGVRDFKPGDDLRSALRESLP